MLYPELMIVSSFLRINECQKNHIKRTTLDQTCPIVRSNSSYYGLHLLIEEQISREIC